MNSFWREIISYLFGPSVEPGTTHCLFTVKISFHHYLIMNPVVLRVNKLPLCQCGTQVDM